MVDNSDQLFKEGKKLYIVGDYGKALEFLSKACKLREKSLGHLHENMYESYYFLAKGYYMFSKYENDLIADGMEIDKDKEIQNDLEVENTEEPIIDTGCTNESSEGVSDSHCESNSNAQDDNEKSSEKEINNDNIQNDQEKSGKNEEDSDENEEKENLTYLQLAYETIECAKLVLKHLMNEKSGLEPDLEIKMADCCDLVGHIYMEEGVINEAIDQYEKALELRKKHLNKFHRTIAESHYNLGVAFGVDMRPGEAVVAYQQCRDIMVECQSFESGSRASELAEVIADLDERINDSKEGERDYALAKESIKQFMISASSDKPVNDLTHLLRRKTNAPRSDCATEEPPASKRKIE